MMSRKPVRPERLNQPYFQQARPVDLIYETVEALWEPIAQKDDWSPLEAHLAHIEQARTAYDWSEA